jgi:hypothetical protein
MREREKMAERWLKSSLEREKYHFFNSSHQNVIFFSKMVPYDEKSLTWVFFLP